MTADVNPEELVYGISLNEWRAAYRPGIDTVYASRFVAIGEGPCVRIGFGNFGAPVAENGNRGIASYQTAVALPLDLALELAATLTRMIQTAPAEDQ